MSPHITHKKVKWSCYRPGVAQRVGRGIAVLFHDRGTRRGWVVSSTPRLHFTPRKDLVPILQEAGWAPGPVWMDRKSLPHRDSIPDRPAHSQLLYQLSYPTHYISHIHTIKTPVPLINSKPIHNNSQYHNILIYTLIWITAKLFSQMSNNSEIMKNWHLRRAVPRQKFSYLKKSFISETHTS